MLVCKSKQHITDKKRIVYIPTSMDSWPSASGGCVVHYVVMHEGKIMHELNCSTCIECFPYIAAYRFTREKEESGTNTLAAR